LTNRRRSSSIDRRKEQAARIAPGTKVGEERCRRVVATLLNHGGDDLDEGDASRDVVDGVGRLEGGTQAGAGRVLVTEETQLEAIERADRIRWVNRVGQALGERRAFIGALQPVRDMRCAGGRGDGVPSRAAWNGLGVSRGGERQKPRGVGQILCRGLVDGLREGADEREPGDERISVRHRGRLQVPQPCLDVVRKVEGVELRKDVGHHFPLVPPMAS
jgi:hypothetical protein